MFTTNQRPNQIPKIRRAVAGAVFCLAMVSGGFSAFADSERELVTPAVDTLRAKVSVVSLREGAIPVTIRALGRIAATQLTPAGIDARVGGIVTEVAFREGEQVHPGDVLLRFDARSAEAILTKAQSDLAVATSELEYAQATGLNEQQTDLDLAAHAALVKADQDTKESDRLASLLEKKLVSDKAATEARQNAESSRREADAAAQKSKNFRKAGRTLELERMRGRVAEANAALGQAELDFAAMNVQAPVDAQITHVLVTVGQSVSAGARLLELEAKQGLGVRFALSPSVAYEVRPTMAFSVYDRARACDWTGTLVAVSAGVDADSGLVGVEGVFESTGNTTPFLGQVLAGEIVTGYSARGFVTPVSALTVTDEGSFIHLVDKEDIAHRTLVQVLATGNEEAVINGERLESGALVIVDGNYNLPDGARVRLNP